MPYGFSFDEERFYEKHDTVHAAVSAARIWHKERWPERELPDAVFVAEAIKPKSPGSIFSWDWFAEHVSEHEDYMDELAEDWDTESLRHSSEIEAAVKEAIDSVLRKHNAMPTHYVCGDVQRVLLTEQTTA